MRAGIAVLTDIIAEAWGELKRARLRTYLALLGVVVGAMGVTVLACTFHLENSLRGEQDVTTIDICMPTLEDYNRTIFRRKPHLKRYELTPADGEALQQACPSIEQAIISGVEWGVDLRGKRWQKASVLSTNLSRLDLFPHALRWGEGASQLAWGRVFTPEEIARGAQVAVIDQRMAQKLWPKSSRTRANGELGNTYLHLNGRRFDIIGVLRSRGPGSETAVIPYTYMQRHFWNAHWYLSAAPKAGSVRAAAREINALLSQRIGDPGYTYAVLPGISYEELKVYTFFGIVGLLVLFSAGAAVSNKAYVDAVERVQQFAVRRALGATRPRIYAVVLTESLLVCGFGSFYGGLIGWMLFASFTAQKWILRSIWYALPTGALAALFLFVMLVGAVGSLQGAALAAAADPAELLARKDVI